METVKSPFEAARDYAELLEWRNQKALTSLQVGNAWRDEQYLSGRWDHKRKADDSNAKPGFLAPLG